MAQDITLAEFREWMREQNVVTTKRFELVAHELRTQRAVWQRELADLRDESRAQREALLRLIDRLPPPEPYKP